MAVYNRHIVTNKGRELLSKAIAGEGEFEISAIRFGAGRYTGNPREAEDLVDRRIDFELINIHSEGAMAVVGARLSNENLETSFRAEELGIYARLKGQSNEILYAYTLADESDVIPDNHLGASLVIDLSIYIEISDSIDATLNITESRVFLTLEQAKEIFTSIGLEYGGLLLGIKRLEKDKVYKALNNKFYLNLNGDRAWDGNGEADNTFEEVSWINLYRSKEPNITRTDTPENDSNKIFTALGALNLKNWLVTNYTTLMNNIKEALDIKINSKLAHGGYRGTGQTLFNLIESAKTNLISLINGKENSFGKNGAFNKNFGTELGTVLEGAKLAETLGLEYDGIVNNSNAKVAGKAYYCTANKAIYKCTQNNSLNYIDANYFEGLSNDKLLGKFCNI